MWYAFVSTSIWEGSQPSFTRMTVKCGLNAIIVSIHCYEGRLLHPIPLPAYVPWMTSCFIYHYRKSLKFFLIWFMLIEHDRRSGPAAFSWEFKALRAHFIRFSFSIRRGNILGGMETLFETRLLGECQIARRACHLKAVSCRPGGVADRALRRRARAQCRHAVEG